MRKAIYPGSFDPFTNGHLDVVERSLKICDKLIIAVAKNSAKQPLFSVEERVEIINTVLGNEDRIEAVAFDGLLAGYCVDNGISMIIRGLRSMTDFEYEANIAAANSTQAPDVETVFLMTKGEYAFISSKIVKEIATFGGNVSSMVPEPALKEILHRLSS